MIILYKIFLAILNASHYVLFSTPAAPLQSMRNPVGFFLLLTIKKLDFFTGMHNISNNNTSHASRRSAHHGGLLIYGDKS